MGFLDKLNQFKFRTAPSMDTKELLRKYQGRKLRTMDGQVVNIETILPSMVRPTRYEINGKHHIVMLDFFKQMNNDDSITQEQIDQFDNIQFEVKRPNDVLDYNKAAIDRAMKEVH